MKQFQEAMLLAKRLPWGLAAACGGWEEAGETLDPAGIELQHVYAGCTAPGDRPFVPRLLCAANPARFPLDQVRDDFAGGLAPDWIWHDPMQDSSFSIQNGVQIHAANGRDLGGLNLGAPRLLRRITGEWAVESVCAAAEERKPALGGILLWRDAQSFLRLDRGTRGRDELSFMGCIGNQEVIVGRGRLASDRIVLRMERRGRRVRSLCSADGRAWSSLGSVEFRGEDDMAVGVYAIGSIDRTLYPGAYRDGTAIHFQSFRLSTDRPAGAG